MKDKKKKIFWIASYPKSGNTWMRAIISSLFFTKDGVFNFDLLKNILDFDIKERYEFVRSINSDDFNKLFELKTIAKYRIRAQKIAKIGGDFAFYKTHSANISTNGYDFTNNSNTFGLIYLVRDPRDIAISYASHLGKTIDEAIYIMSKKNALTYTPSQYPVLMSKWDYHYLSWNNLNVPKIIIKYENLLNNTGAVLNEIIEFFIYNFDININFKNIEFENIIKSTQFKKLQKDEKSFGFGESGKSVFFRKGKAMQWKEKLTNEQIKKIEETFKSNMIALGYI